MKCSNPFCSRSIGLVAHRRWFSNRHYCSRNCRNAFMAPQPQLARARGGALSHAVSGQSSEAQLPSNTLLWWLFPHLWEGSRSNCSAEATWAASRRPRALRRSRYRTAPQGRFRLGYWWIAWEPPRTLPILANSPVRAAWTTQLTFMKTWFEMTRRSSTAGNKPSF